MLAVVFFTASDEPPKEKTKGDGFIITTQAWTNDGQLTVTVKNITTGWHEYNIELIKDGKVVDTDGLTTMPKNDKEDRVFFDDLSQGKYIVKVWEVGAKKSTKTEKIEF